MATTPIFPVKTLQGQVIELEAAVTTVLAEARPKHVHRLRTMTRRMEAQLDLIEAIDGMPISPSRFKAVRRCLKKLRRAAGIVRDLDVQVDAIEDRLTKLTGKLASEGHSLIDALKQDRDHETGELLRTVKRQGVKLVSRTERLLTALEPASERALSESEMKRLIEQSTQEQARRLGAKGREDGAPGSSAEERLHGLRKAAKRARYLAETATEATGTELPQMARQYEQIQESGGTWHDGLTLVRSARQYLGRKAALTRELAKECDRSLRNFEEALQQSSLAEL